jgi:hypothetical protein
MRDSPADISGTWTAQTTCFAAQAQRYTSDHPIAPRLKFLAADSRTPTGLGRGPIAPAEEPHSPARDVLCIPIQLRSDYNLMASISQNPNYLI